MIEQTEQQALSQDECKHEQTEVRNYNMAWHDGDVHCKDCDKFIRYWDAG